MATTLQSYVLFSSILHCLLGSENIGETPTERHVYLRGVLSLDVLEKVQYGPYPDLINKSDGIWMLPIGRLGTSATLPLQSPAEKTQ